jgi:hypothetical protein
MQIQRGESHFSQKWPLANVGKSGEYLPNCLSNVSEFPVFGHFVLFRLAKFAKP